MNTPYVTIVVPAYNCEKTIAGCLRASLAQIYSRDIEIIVVDDGSTDKTGEIIRAFPQVKYIRQENAGPASARNAGAAQARGEFVCFTDSDCTPHSDWVAKLMKHFDDVKVAVVSGSYGIANPKNLLARCVHAEIIWRHKFLLPKFPKSFGSYNFCVRKEVFAATGGFDVSYRAASGEDNDLSYKVLQSGAKIYFESNALVDHVHPEKLLKYLHEQFRHGYWRAKLYSRHPAMSKGDDYTFWKDMIEVPLTALLGISVLLLAVIPGLINIVLVGALFLLALESMFAGLMIAAPNPMAITYWSGAMALRAFCRTAGFLLGALRFSSGFFASKIYKNLH